MAHVASDSSPVNGVNDLNKHDQCTFLASSPPPSSYAPWYKVSRKSMVSVEHPFIIYNIEKGVASLGGSGRLQELIHDSDGATARLYIRPGDRMSKPLLSTNVSTNNVLLKITVPKRTGLKRRKGSQGPFHEGLENTIDSAPVTKQPKLGCMTEDTRYLIRSMRDNPKTYQVQATGTIERTHRFRGMPDFVFSTANMPFMKKMQEHILPLDYEKMKAFAFDMSKGPKTNTEIIPPPAMTRFTLPFNYSYRQNPQVKQITDPAGNVSLVNLKGQSKIIAQSIPYNGPVVPHAPSSRLDPVESLEPALQQLIASARRLLEERPIFTRRAFINCLPGKDWETIGPNSARHIFQYCGYSFSAGPWRDAIIRYGVDPRQDASCRVYQTMMFMLDTQPKDNRAKWTHSMPDHRRTEQVVRKESHLFDGETVSKDGKIWQVCDITEPFLKDLLATTDIRKECQVETDGWYHNGTWSKARLIMKAKITAILTGVPQQHAAYAKVAREMPDNVTPSDKVSTRLGKGATQYEIHLASAIRSNCSSHRVPCMEGTPIQEGESDEDGEDGEIAMPDRSGDDLMDPRITEAALAIDRLEGGTARNEGIVDGMDIDDAPEASMQEVLDHQRRQGD